MADAPSPAPPPVTTRECAAEGCEASQTALTGFCGPHWRKLPAVGQRIVLFHRGAAAQKPNANTPDGRKAAATAAFAMRIATTLIAFIERRWSQRHCMDQIADASHVAQRAGVGHRDIDTTVRAIGWEQIVAGNGAKEEQLELGGSGGSTKGKR